MLLATCSRLCSSQSRQAQAKAAYGQMLMLCVVVSALLFPAALLPTVGGMQPADGITPQQHKHLMKPGTHPATCIIQQAINKQPGSHKPGSHSEQQQHLSIRLDQQAITLSSTHPRRLHPKPLCTGPSCKRISDLLPQLRFKTKGQRLTCVCADFLRARCFAPGCFPCAKSCFVDAPQLAQEPGPFGTGLLCSVGCNPCCQKDGDPDRPANSTCTLVGDC